MFDWLNDPLLIGDQFDIELTLTDRWVRTEFVAHSSARGCMALVLLSLDSRKL